VNTGASSLSAAYALLALDALSKTTATTTVLGISEKAVTDSAAARASRRGDAEGRIADTAASVEFSRRGPSPAYFVLAESGYDKAPPSRVEAGPRDRA
jgi:hypothetical protein